MNEMNLSKLILAFPCAKEEGFNSYRFGSVLPSALLNASTRPNSAHIASGSLPNYIAGSH